MLWQHCNLQAIRHPTSPENEIHSWEESWGLIIVTNQCNNFVLSIVQILDHLRVSLGFSELVDTSFPFDVVDAENEEPRSFGTVQWMRHVHDGRGGRTWPAVRHRRHSCPTEPRKRYLRFVILFDPSPTSNSTDVSTWHNLNACILSSFFEGEEKTSGRARSAAPCSPRSWRSRSILRCSSTAVWSSTWRPWQCSGACSRCPRARWVKLQPLALTPETDKYTTFIPKGCP